MMRSLAQTIGFAGTLLLLPGFSHAQGTLYKWTDSRGNIHYSNTPTGKNAKAVDDTLPPAASFKSPTPPAETATVSPPSSESEVPPSGERGSTTTKGTGSAPASETTADGSQSPPVGDATENEPTPADTETTAPQQDVGGKPALTPEQEQALKDSPM